MIDNESASNYIHEEENSMDNIPKNLNNESPENRGNSFFDILKSKTGEGTLDDYTLHPLNVKNESSIAQIIRGLTGILGALDLAIIDIVLGIIVFVKERNSNV